MRVITCHPKALTASQLQVALRRSIEINPSNAAEAKAVERTPIGRRGGPRRLTFVTANRWPSTGQVLTVQFLDNPSQALRKKILLHMNAWNESCNIRFVETSGVGMVRIARLDDPPEMSGYWSYVGTQILGIEDDQPTLNLEGFTLQTSDTEFRRVVRHEAGHTIGCDHEHMRSELIKLIDRRKAIDYFDETQGWTRQETIDQVLTPLSKKSIMGTTEADPLSIMCYEIPAKITKNGVAIVGGVDINSNDFAFAAKMYPKPSASPPSSPAGSASAHSPAPVQPGNSTSVDIAEVATMSAPPITFLGQPEADTLHIVVMDEFDAEQGLAVNPDSPHFARIFASYGGARVTAPMRLRAAANEPSTAFGKIIRVHEQIKNYTNRQQGGLPTDEEMIQFGSNLFEALFQGDVRRLYDEARSRQQNRKLDIVLTSMIPWIAEKPWEFAYDTGRQSFLATEEIHLVRNVLTAIPANWIPPKAAPLRILIVAAQPVGAGQLSIDQEAEVIRRGFRPLEDAGLIQVEVLPRATPGRMQTRLSTGDFTVVHFIGHSTFDTKTGEGVLLFENEQGGELRLGERSVREIFCRRGLSLVFLNSCESGAGGRKNFNRGVAQALVSHGLPAVVANQYSVLDSSATSFAQHFYWALANGMSVGQSACEARIAVNSSMQGEIIDWAVPVVYVRDPAMSLCIESGKGATSFDAAPVSRSSRRAVQNREVQIAVWDMDNVFPSLGRTLDRMNESQATFGFELAALSVPIDAWDVDTRDDDGNPYLRANNVAERLKNMAAELRVNVLVCITRHWMRDDDWLNIYAWWPIGQKPPLIVCSCAGFDDLAPEGPDTDRAIANITVATLAGFLGNQEAHKKGSKDCPLYFDQERDFAVLTAPQKFDSQCRTKLKKSLTTKQLAALEKLLGTFH